MDWLDEISQGGHPIGNHTYDHVNVTAKELKDLQFRFQRSPWLLRGQSVDDAIRDNIQMTTRDENAVGNRTGRVSHAGGVRRWSSRSPGGSSDVTGVRL